jgi:hypothetical protein
MNKNNSNNEEKLKKKKISNMKFFTIIFIFFTFYFLIQLRKDKVSANLKLLIVRSFFVYLLKSILTKYLLDEEKIEGIFTKRNIITIIISVITFSLFLLFDETNILI